MKLGPLKTAIRDCSAAPWVYTTAIAGKPMELTLQKGPLLAELDKAFPDGRAAETELWLRDDGAIMKEPRGDRS